MRVRASSGRKTRRSTRLSSGTSVAMWRATRERTWVSESREVSTTPPFSDFESWAPRSAGVGKTRGTGAGRRGMPNEGKASARPPWSFAPGERHGPGEGLGDERGGSQAEQDQWSLELRRKIIEERLRQSRSPLFRSPLRRAAGEQPSPFRVLPHDLLDRRPPRLLLKAEDEVHARASPASRWRGGGLPAVGPGHD